MNAFSLRLLLAVPVCMATSGQALASAAQAATPFATSCAEDEEIPPSDRSSVDSAGMQFIQKALGSNPGAAYSDFAAEAKQSLSAEGFVAMVQQDIQPMGPYQDLRVVHTYIATVTGGTQAQRVICGDLESPDGWVALTTRPGPQQAYVLIEGQTVNNTWAFVTSLIQERGNWRVLYFQTAAAGIVGESAEDLWHLARTEQQQRHDFNAFVLYTTALQLAGRGPNLQLGIQPEIQKGLTGLRVPRELQGQAPFTWQFGKSSFKILTVGPIGVGGKIYLNIEQELANWIDDKDADGENRELIAAFKKAYPEYRDVFAGLVVAAREAGGPRGYRTIDIEPASSK